MNLVNQKSLSLTLDATAAVLFFKQHLAATRRLAIVRWIASRQGLPGSYAGMFAPTEKDTLGIRLFTGETIHTQAGIAHQLGEESCRVLALLDAKDPAVKESLRRSVSGMSA
jgi:hypothetical protein